jgi:phosphoribosylanthranilate isomerase
MQGETITSKIPVDLCNFARIQVNSRNPVVDLISEFRKNWERRCIAQTRGEFPQSDQRVDWLYDPSGGRGETPKAWPKHPGGRQLVGYAGGINPENVSAVVIAIDSTGPYWLDMESGVRTDERFSAEKCRRVCQELWPNL